MSSTYSAHLAWEQVNRNRQQGGAPCLGPRFTETWVQMPSPVLALSHSSRVTGRILPHRPASSFDSGKNNPHVIVRFSELNLRNPVNLASGKGQQRGATVSCNCREGQQVGLARVWVPTGSTGWKNFLEHGPNTDFSSPCVHNS